VIRGGHRPGPSGCGLLDGHPRQADLALVGKPGGQEADLVELLVLLRGDVGARPSVEDTVNIDAQPLQPEQVALLVGPLQPDGEVRTRLAMARGEGR